MTFDPLEQKDGGVTRDAYGRRVLVAVDKHKVPGVTEVPGAGTVFDDQGREEVVLQSGNTGANVLLVERSTGADPEAFALADEAFFSAWLDFRTTTLADGTYPLFVVPFALRVTSFTLAPYGGGIAANGANNWNFNLRRFRGVNIAYNAVTQPDGFRDMATAKSTGTDGMTDRLGWHAGAQVPWTDAARVCRPDDVVSLLVAHSGTPAAFSQQLLATVTYERLREGVELT